MISFRSGSCLRKLERVKANSIEVTKIINHYHIPTVQPKYIGPVRFYALLFASSCRPKRNCPAAETERYFEKCYRMGSAISSGFLHYSRLQLESIMN